MKILRTSQNAPYLQGIGVPDTSIQPILEYLMSLDGDDRRKSVRQVRKNPNISIEDLKNISSGKTSHMEQQNVPTEIIEFANSISPKYSVWIAREVSKWLTSLKEWHYEIKQISLVHGANPEMTPELLNLMHKKDPVTGRDFNQIVSNKDLQQRPSSINISDKLKTLSSHVGMMRSTIDWIDQTNPDLMTISMSDAFDHQQEWHAELAAKKDSDAQYKSNDVIAELSNGFTIVKLQPGDCKPEGNKMGHCVEGYSDQINNGTTNIYSLRDPKNEPHATIEIDEAVEKGLDHISMPAMIHQIQGKKNEDPTPEYKEMIKEWFDYLSDTGIKLGSEGDVFIADYTNIATLEEHLSEKNEYGIHRPINGIGGNPKDWKEHLQECEAEGWSGSRDFDAGTSQGYFDSLLEFAIKENQLNELEAGFNEYQGLVDERFDEFKMSLDTANNPSPRMPEEQDFLTEDEDVDQEAYDTAYKNFETEETEYEEYMADLYGVTRFTSYMAKNLNKAKEAIKTAEEQGTTVNPKELVQEIIMAKKSIKFIKTAFNYNDIPDPDQLAMYVETLKLYEKKGKIEDPTFAHVVKNMPSPKFIERTYSQEEGNVLFQSIQYVWKEVTGQDIIQEQKISKHPERLEGNYWIIKNGLLLHGVNHFTVIKNNLTLFCTLMKIETFVAHELLSSDPDRIIKLVLDKGGMRIFINKNREGFFQLSSETYSKWGKKKIKRLELEEKTVKVIDKSRPYKGWSSGITVKL